MAYGLKHRPRQAHIPLNQDLPHCVLAFYGWVSRTQAGQGGGFHTQSHVNQGSLVLYIGNLLKISLEKRGGILIL